MTCACRSCMRERKRKVEETLVLSECGSCGKYVGDDHICRGVPLNNRALERWKETLGMKP